MSNETYVPYNERPVNVSDRYRVVSTNQVVAALEKRGWQFRNQFSAGRGKKAGIHKVHMRLDVAIPNTKGEIIYPEMILLNSYNGTSTFRVQVGLFRLVCSNGLTIVTENWGEIRLRHVGMAEQIAEESTMRILERAHELRERINRLQENELTPEQAIELAMKAAALRWKRTFTHEQAEILLAAARPEDASMDTWSVINRVQEKLEKGGYKLPGFRRTIRPIESPAANARLNEGIMALVLN